MTATLDPIGDPTTYGALSINHRGLGEGQRREVCKLADERGVACRACGSRDDFEVGDALDMGTVWPDEELGTYMIGLSCRTCGASNGLRMHESQLSSW